MEKLPAPPPPSKQLKGRDEARLLDGIAVAVAGGIIGEAGDSEKDGGGGERGGLEGAGGGGDNGGGGETGNGGGGGEAAYGKEAVRCGSGGTVKGGTGGGGDCRAAHARANERILLATSNTHCMGIGSGGGGGGGSCWVAETGGEGA